MQWPEDPVDGLIHNVILLGALAVRADWLLAYGLAQILVGLVWSILVAIY